MKQNIEMIMQNLEHKLQVLDKIIEVNVRQRDILAIRQLDVEEYDKTCEEKAVLIEQVQKLDNEFNRLYERIVGELKGNEHEYVDDVTRIQKCIDMIVNKGATIRELELSNKEIFTRKANEMKNDVKNLRANERIINLYNQNVQNTGIVEPQFMDNKK
jgi:hypothetical protein